jgi:ribosome-associated protein
VLAAAAASAAKKADDILILDVSKQLVITDYFLICSGGTDRQVRTIANEIERQMLKDHGVKPARREGERESRWVVLDYIDFVVHVFHVEDRDYYRLERLWSDAPELHFDPDREERNESAATKAT